MQGEQQQARQTCAAEREGTVGHEMSECGRETGSADRAPLEASWRVFLTSWRRGVAQNAKKQIAEAPKDVSDPRRGDH